MQGRVKFFKMLLRQAKRSGISVQWNQRVREYFEDEVAGVGGVLMENGERKEADVVIAAGKRTLPRAIVTNHSYADNEL